MARAETHIGLLALLVAPQMVQASVQFSPRLEDTIEKASNVHGLAPSILRAFAAIESGGNPRARTGSYFGVYQLSQNEFRKYGGRGNIFDLSENTKAAARKLRAEADAFSLQYWRQPTATSRSPSQLGSTTATLRGPRNRVQSSRLGLAKNAA